MQAKPVVLRVPRVRFSPSEANAERMPRCGSDPHLAHKIGFGVSSFYLAPSHPLVRVECHELELASVLFSWLPPTPSLESSAMGRLPRAIEDGLVYHALNRGNNRAAVFAEEDDHVAFLQALAATKERYAFRLLAPWDGTRRHAFEPVAGVGGPGPNRGGATQEMAGQSARGTGRVRARRRAAVAAEPSPVRGGGGLDRSDCRSIRHRLEPPTPWPTSPGKMN